MVGHAVLFTHIFPLAPIRHCRRDKQGTGNTGLARLSGPMTRIGILDNDCLGGRYRKQELRGWSALCRKGMWHALTTVRRDGPPPVSNADDDANCWFWSVNLQR